MFPNGTLLESEVSVIICNMFSRLKYLLDRYSGYA